jgi:4-aminobutyrate aminotransferase-like enzyme
MIGVELEDKETATAVVKAARARGLVMNTAGGNTLRFVPPLIVERHHVDDAIAILKEAMASVAGSS